MFVWVRQYLAVIYGQAYCGVALVVSGGQVHFYRLLSQSFTLAAVQLFVTRRLFTSFSVFRLGRSSVVVTR